MPEVAQLGGDAAEPKPRSVQALCVTQQDSDVFSAANAQQIWGHTGVWAWGAVRTPALSALGLLSDFYPSHLHPPSSPQLPVSGPYLLCTWGERILMLIANLIVLIAKSII